MAALFLLQTLVGAAAQHYRAEIDELLRHRPGARLPLQPDAHLARAAGDLLGRDLVRRRRHLPRADDRPARAEAPGQARVRAARRARGRRLRDADRLLPRHPRRARATARNWFGLQGFEYLDLARLWQILLSVGLVVWVFMLWRVLRRRLAGEHPGQHALALLPRRLRDPRVLRGRADRPHRRQLHDHGVLALSGSSTSGSRTSSSCSRP